MRWIIILQSRFCKLCLPGIITGEEEKSQLLQKLLFHFSAFCIYSVRGVQNFGYRQPATMSVCFIIADISAILESHGMFFCSEYVCVQVAQCWEFCGQV